MPRSNRAGDFLRLLPIWSRGGPGDGSFSKAAIPAAVGLPLGGERTGDSRRFGFLSRSTGGERGVLDKFCAMLAKTALLSTAGER